jgi:hypothetical protein
MSMAQDASGDYGSGVTFDSIVKDAQGLFNIGKEAYGLYRGSTNDGVAGHTGTGAGSPQTNLASTSPGSSQTGSADSTMLVLVAVVVVLLALS